MANPDWRLGCTPLGQLVPLFQPPPVGNSEAWSASKQAKALVVRLIGWLVGWLIDWLVDRSIEQLDAFHDSINITCMHVTSVAGCGKTRFAL